jgi:protein-L-isoaspartate O-methyltransferase
MKPCFVLLAAALCISAQDSGGQATTGNPEAVVAALQLKPGMTVVQIGTGMGFMLPYLSKAVGPTGLVLAEDIQPEFLEQVRQKIVSEKLTNVTLIQGTDTDPKLPDGKLVDAILLLDAYQRVAFPLQMVPAMRWLRFGRPLVVVESYKVGNLDRNGVVSALRHQLGAYYDLTSQVEHVSENQYLVSFERVLGVH